MADVCSRLIVYRNASIISALCNFRITIRVYLEEMGRKGKEAESVSSINMYLN